MAYQLHVCFYDSCQWWTVPIPVQPTFLYSCRRYVIQCPPLGRGVSGQQSRRGHETFLLLLCGIRSWPPGHNMLTTQHTLVHTTLVRGRCKFISSSCELIIRLMDEASNPARYLIKVENVTMRGKLIWRTATSPPMLIGKIIKQRYFH